jgi:lipopolysaccharide transport system ATP-binding protein
MKERESIKLDGSVAIRINNISKCYQIYERPQDRLKQAIVPRFQRFFHRKLSRYARDFWALKDVSFEVIKGETVGIIGRNGSGKSTLLQMICGTITPSGGRVETNGRVAALLELGAGFNPEYSGRENIFLSASLLGISKDEINNKFDAIADFAEIGEFMDQPVKTYSSGMYARVAFSASVFIDPDILLIDEILAVGDAPFQAKCIKAFNTLRDNGCTIMLVSHDAYMIRNFCQKAIYLKNGKFMGFGPSSKIIDQYTIEIEKALSTTRENILDNNIKNITSSSDFTAFSLFRIFDIELLGEELKPVNLIASGQSMTLKFRYKTLTKKPPKVVFVFSLYRHDGLYICGNTTLMDKLLPFDPGRSGTVSINFPSVKLLAGRYIWRVAIDDEKAFGIYSEVNQVCEFQVVDQLEAVGLFNLNRTWSVQVEGQ